MSCVRKKIGKFYKRLIDLWWGFHVLLSAFLPSLSHSFSLSQPFSTWVVKEISTQKDSVTLKKFLMLNFLSLFVDILIAQKKKKKKLRTFSLNINNIFEIRERKRKGNERVSKKLMVFILWNDSLGTWKWIKVNCSDTKFPFSLDYFHILLY